RGGLPATDAATLVALALLYPLCDRYRVQAGAPRRLAQVRLTRSHGFPTAKSSNSTCESALDQRPQRPLGGASRSRLSRSLPSSSTDSDRPRSVTASVCQVRVGVSTPRTVSRMVRLPRTTRKKSRLSSRALARAVR